jgi:hypothetical protein
MCYRSMLSRKPASRFWRDVPSSKKVWFSHSDQGSGFDNCCAGPRKMSTDDSQSLVLGCIAYYVDMRITHERERAERESFQGMQMIKFCHGDRLN